MEQAKVDGKASAVPATTSEDKEKPQQPVPEQPKQAPKQPAAKEQPQPPQPEPEKPQPQPQPQQQQPQKEASASLPQQTQERPVDQAPQTPAAAIMTQQQAEQLRSATQSTTVERAPKPEKKRDKDQTEQDLAKARRAVQSSTCFFILFYSLL